MSGAHLKGPTMITKRRLSRNERIECACCGTPRWGDVSESVYEADGSAYCDETCARDRGATGDVVVPEAPLVLPVLVSWVDEVKLSTPVRVY